jgi:beta-glucosidase
MRGGRAIAELVLGHIEPSGRLPVSFPRHVGQQPIYYNGIRGQHGDRYADLSQDPQFAFGEGLSYTTVAYSDLVVTTPEVAPGGTIQARVTLTNTGTRPARETVQVYVSDLVTSVTWAEKELKSFRQVDIHPGESVAVDLELPAASCTIVDAEGHRIVEPGEFNLLVGPSSKPADLLTASFRINTAGNTDRAWSAAPTTSRPTPTGPESMAGEPR